MLRRGSTQLGRATFVATNDFTPLFKQSNFYMLFISLTKQLNLTSSLGSRGAFTRKEIEI
jgi:hypothetical protein